MMWEGDIDKSKNEITEAELFAELDKAMNTFAENKHLTEIQFKIIDKARTGDSKMGFKEITKFINSKFNLKLNVDQVKGRYRSELEKRNRY